MSGLDLRGQNRLLKRVFFVIPPLVAAFIRLGWDGMVAGQGFRAALGGAFFLLMVGSVVAAIFAGFAIPRMWMRLGDRDREIMLRGGLIANVLGWTWLATALWPW
jgi:hypothetical protein